MNASLPVPLDPELQEQDPLERELNDFMGRTTFTDQMIAANKKKKNNTDPLSFAHELREYWFLYAFLAVSALFTGMLGIFMGLSPKVQADGSVFFHTDFPHILMAILYGVSFITVTEFAFGLAKRLFYMRESGNLWQVLSMLTMMIIAGFSVFGTGVAGGVIIASTIDFMSAFVTVPEWAQYWVVRVIPALIVLYSFLLVVYALSSTKAETERIIRDKQRNHELDMDMRRKTLRQFAQEKIEREALKLYMKQINDGSISVAEALAAARADDIFQAISKEAKRPRRATASSPVQPQIITSPKQLYCLREGCRNSVVSGQLYCSADCEVAAAEEGLANMSRQVEGYRNGSLQPRFHQTPANWEYDAQPKPISAPTLEPVPVTMSIGGSNNGNGHHPQNPT